VTIRDDAFGLVGDHAWYAATLEQGANSCGVLCLSSAQSDNEERLARTADEVLELRADGVRP
jgi:hypothetical protein